MYELGCLYQRVVQKNDPASEEWRSKAVANLDEAVSLFETLGAAHDLQLAQRAARASGSTTTVAFDTANHVYQLTGVDALDGSGVYGVNLQDAPYQSTLVTAAFGAGNNTLTFNGWGVPDTNGVVVVVADA